MMRLMSVILSVKFRRDVPALLVVGFADNGCEIGKCQMVRKEMT